MRALVDQYVHEITHNEPRRGCFIANTAMELVPGDSLAARRVEANWNVLETALVTALTRARAQGELATGTEPRGLARFLLVMLQGLKVVGKGAPDPDRIRDARMKTQHPMGRVAHTEEITAGALCLASPESSFTVGHELVVVVDGGATA